MSRSNPNEHLANPATRWFEWNSEGGTIRYYDKDEKKNVNVDLPFTFILLDQLKSVGGWHDPSQSGIYANEVRDISQDVMVVKSFKGGILAEGRYTDIKESIKAQGGRFVANCYIAFKGDDGLVIGSLRFKGAALGAWMEFERAHKSVIYKQAVVVTGFTEGKKGSVKFKSPTFGLAAVADDTNRVAMALDRELQTFLTAYLRKTKKEQAEQVTHAEQAEQQPEPQMATVGAGPSDIADDDIPFAWLLPLVLPALALLGGVLA